MIHVLYHSVDTVKTRLQGQPSANPPKYNNMFHAYGTILREEGVARGLYSGVTPAMSGSCKFSWSFFFLVVLEMLSEIICMDLLIGTIIVQLLVLSARNDSLLWNI